MVNFIEAQKPLLSRLMKMAGLRPIEVELEPGTTMHVWAPKHHVGKKGTTISPLEPTAAAADADAKKKKKTTTKKRSPESRPNVVLIHGFAAEGNVTWQFNFGVLVSRYNLYIPDLMFFGKSTTSSADRSPDFQAACVAGALARLGVAHCDVVGFSYGGMVAFKLAEARPDLVRSLCVSGSVVAMTDAVNRETMERLGAGSSAELLMPDTLKGLKALLSVSMYKKMWFPDRFYKDYLKVMFTNRKERMELLQGLITSNMDAKIPVFQQKIMLLWGEEDKIFNIELAKKMKEQLGDNCFLYGIRKAGHLLHVERPCAYNRQLQRWFAYVNSTAAGDQAS
ncbi:uncharacterized protein LOC110434544 [Sorghum bicolor]|uniref:AB hydrolase-1 domain-containing protein n=1 Tax=Sorghum bicolor TaxID=4558 RepID=A0A194YRU7_SORBI|nr:uncharacterized protein LOC110434544 [Sorghum bicolor]KXG30912.1 hypothetical protein SORBI_3004G266700 [Sorghum bicolor]|eukprot:XP_021314439.1 uncharacterized protein LOC110434544 [Sorghum bicolor]